MNAAKFFIMILVVVILLSAAQEVNASVLRAQWQPIATPTVTTAQFPNALPAPAPTRAQVARQRPQATPSAPTQAKPIALPVPTPKNP